MLSYNESLKILKETNALLEGHFILSSGLHSKQYIQCAKLLSHPKQAKIICSSLKEKINANLNNVDIVLSPAIGGIVVGYEIACQLNVKSIFAERVENKFTLRRGFVIPKNSNVLIVEDVITTGKSILECTKMVKQNESNVIGYACIINRSENDQIKEHKIISQIKMKIQTFKEDELPIELKNIPVDTPGSRHLSK